MEIVATNTEIVNILKFLLLSLTNCVRFNREFQINNCHLLSRMLGLKKPYKCISEVQLYYFCYAVTCKLKKNNFTNKIIDDFQVKITEMNYYLICKYNWLTINKDAGDIMPRLCTILEISNQQYIPTNNGTVFISDIAIGRTKRSIVFAGTLLHNDGTTLNIAIKIQPLSDAAKTEGRISMRLSGKPGIPLYFCHGNYDNMFYYIVMELLGPSLKTMVYQNKSEKMLFGFIDYVLQFINIMKILYLERMFHLDITVSNILFGLDKLCDTIYLIDYHDIGNGINNTNEELNRITNGCLHHSIMYILTNMINDYDDIFYYESIIIKIITNPFETPHFDLLTECISNSIQ